MNEPNLSASARSHVWLLTGRPDMANGDILAHNRAGEITAEQKKWVYAGLAPRALSALVGLFLIPFFLCIGSVIFTSEGDTEDAWIFFIMMGIFALVFGGIALNGLLGLIRLATAHFDLSSGRAEQADGRLMWQRRAWRGVIEGRTLELLRGAELMPGAYRFYYLPRTGIVISAERLALGSTQALDELRQALGDVLDFTDDDLPENRAGRLSTRQTASRTFSALRTGLFLSPFLLMALAFAGVFPFLMLIQPMWQGEPVDTEGWIAAGFGLLFGGLFAVLLGWAILSPFVDVWQGRVDMIEGPMEERAITTGSGKSRRTNYYFEINNQRFQVPQVAQAASVAGRRYRLYYFPRTKNVVSVEPLSEREERFQ
jgi:hypothetical protein